MDSSGEDFDTNELENSDENSECWTHHITVFK
jgi:hypothetical protein